MGTSGSGVVRAIQRPMATPLTCEPSFSVNGVDPVFVIFAEAVFPKLLFAFLFNLLLKQSCFLLLCSWAFQGLP